MPDEKNDRAIDVVLATASPRRRELIKKIPFLRPQLMKTEAEEIVLPSAVQTATVNARRKGEWAAVRTHLPVLAFDTVVGVADRVLGKPRTRDEAVAMFELLCGRKHEVVTAVYFRINSKIIEKTEKTTVEFGAFDAQTVYNYVDSGAPYDKAGGYNIDDAAIKPLVKSVDGDYCNVVGLPVALTEKLIEENINVETSDRS